jgi:hypothetical protein
MRLFGVQRLQTKFGFLTFDAGNSKGPHRAIDLLAVFLNFGSALSTRSGFRAIDPNALHIEVTVPVQDVSQGGSCRLSILADLAKEANSKI